MKKSLLTVVLPLTCLLGLGVSARAQEVDKLAVNVPSNLSPEVRHFPQAHTALVVSLLETLNL